jgi:tight adherence protein B
MTALCLVGTVVAVLLATVGPAGRGLRVRLSPQGRPQRRPRRWPLVSLGVVVMLGVWTGSAALAGGRGAMLAVAGSIVAATTLWLVRQRARRRSAQAAQVAVAHACEVLASHLRVGQVPTEALFVAAQDCPVLLPARQVQDVGGDVTRVWREQAGGAGHAGLLELARAWQVCTETGAPLAPTLEQVAAALSAEESLRAMVAGELASPRATSKVMAALPACGIGLGYLLGGDPIRWLLAGPLGWVCVVAGVLMACLGVLWIEMLARQASGHG